MHILFICTGNTCRSPMAEALCRARHPDWMVSSAGIGVREPLPASAYAAEAVKAYGADLGGHVSRQVTAAMLDRADVVVPMTSSHAQFIRVLFPDYAAKLRPLGEIADPFGGDRDDYARCAEQIGGLVDRL